MRVQSLSPFLLFIARDLPSELQSEESCLTQEYYGTSSTGKYSFHGSADTECFERVSPSLFSAHLVPTIRDPSTQFVWLEQIEADASLLSPDVDIAAIVRSLQYEHAQDESQYAINDGLPNLEILHTDSQSLLVRMEGRLARLVDSCLPPFWKSMILPERPIDFIPVPEPAVERVKTLLSQVKFDPVVASIVNNISVPQMKEDIRFLTGEDPESPIISRHSFSDGVLIAADWLKEHFEATGASCKLEPFLSGFAPNVIWFVI